jgi:hypothetical protein
MSRTEKTGWVGLLSRSPDCVDLDCVAGCGVSPRSPGGPCRPSLLNPDTQHAKHASRCMKPLSYAQHTHAYARIFEKDWHKYLESVEHDVHGGRRLRPLLRLKRSGEALVRLKRSGDAASFGRRQFCVVHCPFVSRAPSAKRSP